jgi:hypothetical protein
VDDDFDLQTLTYGYLFQWDPVLPGLMVPAAPASAVAVSAVAVSAVPEPGTWLLLAAGAAAAGAIAARTWRVTIQRRRSSS